MRMRNIKRIKVRKKYKAKYPDISRMNLSSVGQDVQISTVLTWKNFQKLYILPNIRISQQIFWLKKKKEIKVDLCESFKRNNLINFEENKGLISSSTIQIWKKIKHFFKKIFLFLQILFKLKQKISSKIF